MHSVEGASTGSPREILQLGYKVGFINDAEVWLLMLKKCNTSVHIWNEDEVNEMIILIRDSFIPAFKILNETLWRNWTKQKVTEGRISMCVFQPYRYCRTTSSPGTGAQNCVLRFRQFWYVSSRSNHRTDSTSSFCRTSVSISTGC